MKSVVFLLASLSILTTSKAQNIAITNPSLEGTPNCCKAPSGWYVCWGTPDIQPGGFCVTLPPSHGSSYVGIGSRNINAIGGGDGIERVGQTLSTPMQKGKLYKFYVDLSITNTYWPSCGGYYIDTVNFEFWGGTCPCCRTKLLAKVDTVDHVGWRTYELSFTPDSNYTHILFQSNLQDNNIFANTSYLLVDNFSPYLYEVGPTLTITSPSAGRTQPCSYTVSGHTDSVYTKVMLYSSLLNTKDSLFNTTNDTLWSFTLPAYPLTCSPRTDTLIATGYFPGGKTYTDTLIVKIRCIDATNCPKPPPIPPPPDNADYVLYIPNLITPNGDGLNDEFQVSGFKSQEVKIAIRLYNCWGDMVYENKEYKNDWSGEAVGEGMYFYYIEINNNTYKGWLQIIR
jgi:gliding motility-associated-like protein